MSSSEEKAVESQDEEVQPEEVESHFWVCTYPYFETTVFINQCTSHRCQEHFFTIYDADGIQVNSGSIAFPNQSSGILDVGSLLGSCKLESGLKHAHLVLRSIKPTQHYVRLMCRERASLVKPLVPVSEERSNFVPVTLGSSTVTLCSLVNFSDQKIDVRLRLFIGKRSPEHIVTLPAHGARAVYLEQIFVEYLSENIGRTPAYIRVSSKSNQPIGMQMLEQVDAGDQHEYYMSFC